MGVLPTTVLARIDILARIGILLLLPLGFQMVAAIGVNPFGAWVLVWDERARYVVIPLLFFTALCSLITGGPLLARWYTAKVLIYSLLLYWVGISSVAFIGVVKPL